MNFSQTVLQESSRLVEVYHPFLWSHSSKIYPCCGSSQRSTSKLTNGCCPVTWSPNSIQHMGINLSHFHSAASSSTPVASNSTSNGAAETVKPSVEGAATTSIMQPPSPSSSHSNAAVLSPGICNLCISVTFTVLLFSSQCHLLCHK